MARRGEGVGRLMRSSLVKRRTIAVAISLLLFSLTLGMQALVIEMFVDDGRLVATETHSTGTITAVHVGRCGDDYDIAVDGQTRWLDYSEYVPGGVFKGKLVEVVVDPEWPERAIAVGTPSDWDRSPRIEWSWRVILLTGAVLLSLAVAALLLPEDRRRITRRWIPRTRSGEAGAALVSRIPGSSSATVLGRWVRRAAVITVALVLGTGAYGLIGLDRRTTEDDARVAATGKWAWATVVAKEHQRFGDYEYTVDVEGIPRLLHEGFKEERLELGERIQVVMDPLDPGRALVAEPFERWVPDWRHDVFMLLLFGGIASAGTIWVAVKLLPPSDKKWIAELGKRDV